VPPVAAFWHGQEPRKMPRRKLLALLTLAFAGQDGLRKGAVFKTQNVAPIHTARFFLGVFSAHG